MFNNPYISNETIYIVLCIVACIHIFATSIRLYPYVYFYLKSGGIIEYSRLQNAITIYLIIQTIVFIVLTVIARNQI